MFKKALLLATMCFSAFSSAQDSAYDTLEEYIRKYHGENGKVEVIEKIKFDKLRTPQSEVEDAILFLSKLPKQDAQFIRFFSTYAVPQKDREDTVLALSFVIHSLVGINTKDINVGNAGSFYPLAVREDGLLKEYRRVPGSDTLWWIDLREYNWTPEAWEKISNDDPYFAEPVVAHDRSGILRLLAGNAVVRADWFIKHSTDVTNQADVGDDDFYTTLLYALSEKPDNIDEWRKAWGVDIKDSRSIGNEFGTLVTKSNAVARANRMLFGYRTELGYLYETYDVTNQRGKRDYLESLLLNKNPGEPPEISDAGEAFTSNTLGLQVYALRDAEGNLINFADPTVARHMNDVIGDVRVRVAHSCLDCHASGPIPSENTLKEFIRTRANIKLYDKRDSLRLKRSLLSDKFKQSVEDNQILFARAVKRTNGLNPDENGRLYLNAVSKYAKSVNLAKAAYECGVTEDVFRSAVKRDYRFGARLKLLVQTGEPIPRDIWESPGEDGIPGAFQQAMILLHGLTTLTEEKKEIIVEPKSIKSEYVYTYKVQSNRGIQVRARDKNGVSRVVGTVYNNWILLATKDLGIRTTNNIRRDGIVSGQTSWVQVYLPPEGKFGWIPSQHVVRGKMELQNVLKYFDSDTHDNIRREAKKYPR